MANVSKKQVAVNQSTASDIINLPPRDLIPYPENSREHPVKQIAMLKACITEFNIVVPILIDENGVILSGHGRTLAAIELDLPTVPVRVISGMTEAKKRAYRIADNKISEQSKWDKDKLKAEIEILTKLDFKIEMTGFSTAEIDIMIDDADEPKKNDPDDLLPEDITEEIVSHEGDLWLMGEHLLICGDALKADYYDAIMQGNFAQMVVSDVPYNVKIDGHVGGNGKIKHREFAMASGEMSPEQFTTFLNTSFTHMHAFAQEGAINFFFIDWRHITELQQAAKPIFGPPRQLCVWNKEHGGMGTFYRSQHELVFVYKKGDAPHINNFELGQHGRYRTNVWSYPSISSVTEKNNKLLSLHPTCKPASLIADAIRDCSHRKGLILDPFAGSGTILIAAERTGRHARAIEIDPHFCDVGVMRWQRVTGRQAVLAATGQTWDQVRAERLSTKA